jgi:hypothetical protein
MSLTQRFLRATPMRLETTLSLVQIQRRMSQEDAHPHKEGLVSGWGSYDDGDEILGLPNFTPRVSGPIIWPSGEDEPETLVARFYYYNRNAALKRFSSARDDPAQYHLLAGVDVLLSPIDGAQGSYTVLISSWDSNEVTFVSDALELLIRGMDDASILVRDSSVLHLIDPDFFLWLIRREFYEPQLTEDMALDGVRHVDARDALRHTVAMGSGLDSTRGELLYLVSQETVTFGPGKFVIAHDRAHMNVDLELKVDGSFAVIMGSTTFDVSDEETAQLDDFQRRIRAFQYSAHVIIPELKECYQRDVYWQTHGRNEFRRICREETNRRTT